MSTATKKPPAASRDPINPASSPSRTQPRSSAPATPSAPGAANANINRTRSIRSGTPVSARAAAPRRDSPLGSISNSTSNSGSTNDVVEREEALRAENIAALDDLKERLVQAEGAAEQYKRQAEVLQNRLDDAIKEQVRLEEKVHENEEHIDALKNERRETVRQIREMEAIYEAERSAMTKEKEEMANREEEMQMVIQRLKDSLAQRNANGDEEMRPSRHANSSSPSVDSGSFAPPSSLHRSDSRNNSKILLQKDKLIESLRLELAEAQIKLVESENQGGGRLQEVERLLMEARMANARLMEDNESYQLLLQERTLNGDFSKTDFSYMNSGGMPANQDALNALEGRSSAPSLADELSEAGEAESENYRRVEAELRSMKDQNKALTLYINKIIERLLQHQEFEHILDQSSESRPNTNKELPPPPSEKLANAGASLLQRAKSIAVGASGAAKPKTRPMSFMPSAAPANTAHNNPETAPSIPLSLTRGTSVRRNRPMSEQFTGGVVAASLVNAMYKGPDGASTGPLSPPLRSQIGLPAGGPGNRTPSGPGPATSGNFPGMRSETSSTSGDSVGEVSTPPSQSPPRPAPGSGSGAMGGAGHEKATTFAGNKPRPLRLVQENADTAGRAGAGPGPENKRASWIGWAFGGVKKEDMPPVGAGESIRE